MTLQPGFFWCATIHQVTYLDELSQVVAWEENPPWGCACIDPETHDSLLAELDPVTEDLVIENDADQWLKDARLMVWQWAWRECEDTPIPAGGVEESDNCSDQNNQFYADLFYDNLDELTGNPEPIYPIENGGLYAGCDHAGNFEPPEANTCTFVDGAYTVDCSINGTQHDCTVDGGDLDNFFAHPECIKLEGAQITLAASGPYWYRLDGINAGEFLYALGLQNGDRPYEINGYPLTNPFEAAEAWVNLRGESEWVFKVKRSGVTHTFNFDRDD